MGLESVHNLATSSWLQFGYKDICLALSKCSDSSTECLSSSQRQPKPCFAVISHSIVIVLLLVRLNEAARLVSKEYAQFMSCTNLTIRDKYTSGIAYRRVM